MRWLAKLTKARACLLGFGTMHGLFAKFRSKYCYHLQVNPSQMQLWPEVGVLKSIFVIFNPINLAEHL